MSDEWTDFRIGRTHREFRGFTDEARRALFADPCDNPTYPFVKSTPDEMKRLPSILRLGCGHETSIGTRLMRLAADEIESLRESRAALEQAVRDLDDALASALCDCDTLQYDEPDEHEEWCQYRVTRRRARQGENDAVDS